MAAAGHDPGSGEPGCYGAATEAAVRGFQARRGLPVDGVCGELTWSALVEAGYRLGDRLLYLRSPMLRGDDVADLQRRLGALGFDAGRVDGIFGPHTETALEDFQRNAGLTSDGILGPDTRAALLRLGGRAASPDSVAGLRERESLRQAPRTLAGRTVVVGQGGGVEGLAAVTARSLRAHGAQVVALHDPDGSAQARQANEAAADLYVGLATHPARGGFIAYYSTAGFESVGGRRLAEIVARELVPSLGLPRCECRGMTLPVLRETRMPAILCQLGPPAMVVERTGTIAEVVAVAVARWAQAPVDS